MSGSEYTGGRVPDLTMARAVRGPGLPYGGYLFAVCGHKGQRAGGTFRGNVPMRCPKCTAERKAKKETA
ncbi:MAG: hypothetical protein QG616_2416, partial [Pseudomonadota bacterium]|nr:hypothetical protein [Pseudomonadota bacterium]